MPYPRLTKCLPNESRHNLYFHFHKALRLGHCRMLSELGPHDFSNDACTADALHRLSILIGLGRAHLEGEEREINAALDERRPGAARNLSLAHCGHHQALAELESLIRSVNVAIPARRPIAGQSLYRCYALFVAADMAHMNSEETELLTTLHEAFTDDELKAMEARMLAAIPPEDMAAYMSFMMPALSDPERMVVIARLQSALPPLDFKRLLTETIKPLLAGCSVQAA